MGNSDAVDLDRDVPDFDLEPVTVKFEAPVRRLERHAVVSRVQRLPYAATRPRFRTP